MKRISIFLLVTVLLFTFTLIGCNDGASDETETITLNRTSLSLNLLDTFDLTVSGTDKAIQWSSSDTAIVEIIGSGKTVRIVGKKVGTATVTAKTDKAQASCTVTVNEGSYVPMLQITNLADDGNLYILLNDSYQLQAQVVFGDRIVDNVTFSFAAEDQGIVSVSSEGLVTALKTGTEKITVSASWNDYNILSKTFYAVVRPNMQVFLDENTIEISSYNGTIDGKTFLNYRSVEITTYKDGAVDDNPDSLVWTKIGGDDGIVTVDQNNHRFTATGRALGEVTYKLTYTKDSESVETTLTIKVNAPIIDRTNYDEKIVSKDLGDWEKFQGKWSGDFNAFASGLGAQNAEVFKAINLQTSEEYLFEDGEIKTKDLDDIELGEQRFRIFVQNDNGIIAFDTRTKIVSKVITTEQEIYEYPFGTPGYAILGSNIDLKGATAPNLTLEGTFDGNGYIISGFKIEAGYKKGFFAELNKNSVVRNVSFLNIQGPDVAYLGPSGVIGYADNSLMENIYLEIKLTAGSLHSEEYFLMGGLCGENAGVIRNCIVVVDPSTPNGLPNIGAAIGFNMGVMSNVFAITTSDLKVICLNADWANAENCETYSSVADLLSEQSTLFRSGSIFNNDMWLYTSGSGILPILKNSQIVMFSAPSVKVKIGKPDVTVVPIVKGGTPVFSFSEGYRNFAEVTQNSDGSLNIKGIAEGEFEITASMSSGASAVLKVFVTPDYIIDFEDYDLSDSSQYGGTTFDVVTQSIYDIQPFIQGWEPAWAPDYVSSGRKSLRFATVNFGIAPSIAIRLTDEQIRRLQQGGELSFMLNIRSRDFSNFSLGINDSRNITINGVATSTISGVGYFIDTICKVVLKDDYTTLNYQNYLMIQFDTISSPFILWIDDIEVTIPQS